MSIGNGIEQEIGNIGFFGIKFNNTYQYYYEIEGERLEIDLRKPFKALDKYNIEYNGDVDDYIKALEDDENIAGGYVYLVMDGGINCILIINGECSGEIWIEELIYYNGFYPLLSEDNKRITFSEWYIKRLEEEIEIVK